MDYDKGHLIIDENKELHSTVIDSLKIDLDRFDLELLMAAITIKTNYSEDEMAACFNPHHGIILKNQKKIVGDISICFECNQYKLRPKNVHYVPMMIFKKICSKYNLPIDRKTISKLYYQK